MPMPILLVKKDALFTINDPSSNTIDSFLSNSQKQNLQRNFFMPFVEFDKAIENTTKV